MAKVVLLDTGPLGMVTHPRPNREIVEWLRALLAAGASVLVPEIADYELRRELLRAQRTKGIARLDTLERTLGCIFRFRQQRCGRPQSFGPTRAIADFQLRTTRRLMAT
jgi:hypothetical protein